jgi:hypothetical protein
VRSARIRDPDIAAYLAFLYLRMSPAQPKWRASSRAVRDLRQRLTALCTIRRRGTLAIASALAGRNIEATRAFFVEVALTSNLDRTCQTALSAYHSFGERLRVPVHAMLDRIDSSDRVSLLRVASDLEHGNEMVVRNVQSRISSPGMPRPIQAMPEIDGKSRIARP